MAELAWLSEPALRLAAEPDVFARGQDYAAQGAVLLQEVGDDHISATVIGSRSYAVELTDEDGTLTWVCTCPYAEDGSFCKHLVAVGLAASERHTPPGDLMEPGGETVTDAELRSWLDGRDRDELASLLMDVARLHPDLRRELELRAATDRGLAPDVAGYDAELATAFDTGGFVPWREMHVWASAVLAALDDVASLLEAGFHDAVVSLAERGCTYLEHAYGHVDDSSGELAVIADRLVDLHLDALRTAKADTADTAEHRRHRPADPRARAGQRARHAPRPAGRVPRCARPGRLGRAAPGGPGGLERRTRSPAR